MGNYNYNYSYGSGGNRNGRDSDDIVSKVISWIVSVAFLCAIPPIGIFMVIRNIISAANEKKSTWIPPWEQQNYYGTSDQQSTSSQRTYSGTSGNQSARDAQQAGPAGGTSSSQEQTARADVSGGGTTAATGGFKHTGNGNNSTAPVGSYAAAATKKLNVKSIVFMIIGLVLGGIGLATLLPELYWIFYGLFWLEDIVMPVLLILIASGFLISSIAMRRKMGIFKKFLAVIGKRRAIKISHVAAAIPVSFKSACGDLQKMINKGYFGDEAYLDMESKYFLMSAADKPEAEKSTATAAPQPGSYQSILLDIRRLNDQIADGVVSAKIDRIEALTAKIFRQVEENPDKVPQIRSFMSYYLPTTLKLLDSYRQLERQGIDGKNISASKSQIEGILDTLISGFERQLDRLFEDDMMDVSSDVEVLETMLRRDGLSSVSPFGSVTSSGATMEAKQK